MKYAAVFIGVHTAVGAIGLMMSKDPDNSQVLAVFFKVQWPGWSIARALMGEWAAGHIGIEVPLLNIVIYGLAIFVVWTVTNRVRQVSEWQSEK